MQATRGAPVAPPEPIGAPAPRRAWWLALTAAVVLVADVISKHLAVARLSGRAPVHVVGTLLQLTLRRNAGAAFSIGGGGGETVVFSAVAVVVAAVIVRTARTLRSRGWAIALGLLLGGALGNLGDRIFRAPGPFRGHVVDWIELPHWPVFNLADSAIVCGAVLAMLLVLLGIETDGSRR